MRLRLVSTAPDPHTFLERFEAVAGDIVQAQCDDRRDPSGRTIACAADDDLRRGRWRTRSMLATTVVSFLSGALFWHLVGFWTFLSGVVFNENGADEVSRPTAVAVRESVPLLQPAAPPARGSAKEPASLAAAELGRENRNASAPPVQHATSESLTDLLQCSQARKSDGPSVVQACPPLRRRLPVVASSQRGNRHLDAREAAERLATGWQTGVARIETGSLP